MSEASKRVMTSGYQLPEYEPVFPDSIAGGQIEEHEIVIIGAGLSGLAAAADFSARGVPVVVLDEDTTVGVRGASSRGIAYPQKTLEIMEGLGTYERMRAKGVEWSVGRTLAGDDVVYSFDRGATKVSRQPAFVNLQQFYVEWYLVDRIVELDQAELRWGNKVVSVVNEAEGALLEVETARGRYRIRARWVIDASGVASDIRRGLGLDSHTARTADRWCICDVRLKSEMPAERWTWVEAAFNYGRAVWQHPMADGVWRLDYQCPPDVDPDHFADLDVARERVQAHLGPDTEFELVWVGPYQYRTELLDDFRHGDVFFIGDAAHVMSPFGGRGGNSGIQDAENLVWKMTMVRAGLAPESLLDSYSTERREAAIQNLEVTSRTGRFLAPQSAREARMRAAVIELARRYDFARPLVNTGRLSEPNRYHGSPIISGGGGFSLPNVTLYQDGRETSLMQVVRGLGPKLLALLLSDGAGPDDFRNLEARLPGVAVLTLGAAGADLADDAGALARSAGAQPGDCLVIRPDLYCASIVPAAELAGLESVLKRAKGEIHNEAHDRAEHPVAG